MANFSAWNGRPVLRAIFLQLLEYGQSAYWTKQTDNEVVLEGIVDDWKLFPMGLWTLPTGSRRADGR